MALRPILEKARSTYNIGEFILGSVVLGTGSFSQVKIGQELTSGETVAVKIIDKTKLSPSEMDCVNTEVNILRRLKHPHIVRYVDHLSDPDSSGLTFIVLEYVPGGNLFQYLKRKDGILPEAEAKRVMHQALEAIAHCHAMQISHRDLKLEHILLDADSNVKVIDFGLASYTPPDVLVSNFCGSYIYSAPEIVNAQPYLPQKADVWALGVIMYVLLFGRFPFIATETAALKKKISSGVVKFSWSSPRPRPSPEATDLILRMLSLDPRARPTCKEILADSWFGSMTQLLNSSDDDWFDL